MKLTDPNRRGLLGQGSILALTSVATRTSPVFRGKYVLSTFLNTPPPPPPPNVPSLEESNKGVSDGGEDSACAIGVAPQEPALRGVPSSDRSAGFALENFNSVGQWRDTGADGAPLDVAGMLADGSKVNGPVALRQAIVAGLTLLRRWLRRSC